MSGAHPGFSYVEGPADGEAASRWRGRHFASGGALMYPKGGQSSNPGGRAGVGNILLCSPSVNCFLGGVTFLKGGLGPLPPLGALLGK